jgi:diamine N-acetyltransferase
MIIRLANDSDIGPLSQLAVETYTAAFGHSFEPADLVAHLEHHLSPQCIWRILREDRVLVAEVDGRLVGYVQFGDSDFDAEAVNSGDQELRRLYVLPAYQNQGIGAHLMEAALDHPTIRAASRIFLDVWEHNPGAQRFYARHGFKVIGRRQFVVESGAETSDDLLMVRDRLEQPAVPPGGQR